MVNSAKQIRAKALKLNPMASPSNIATSIVVGKGGGPAFPVGGRPVAAPNPEHSAPSMTPSRRPTQIINDLNNLKYLLWKCACDDDYGDTAVVETDNAYVGVVKEICTLHRRTDEYCGNKLPTGYIYWRNFNVGICYR